MEARISQSTVGPGEKLCTVILRDVTERKRIEREREDLLARAREAAVEAERANRAKDDFLAMVSHERRTPLTPLLAWAAVLRTRTVDAATTSRALETIERAARAQARLVEDLLDMSRIVAGKIRLDVRRMQFAPAVAAAVDWLRPAAEAKEILLHTDLDASASPISDDRDRLQQVVWNLLSNAIKFTRREGGVAVVLGRVGAHLELVVRDTGKGIEPPFPARGRALRSPCVSASRRRSRRRPPSRGRGTIRCRRATCHRPRRTCRSPACGCSSSTTIPTRWTSSSRSSPRKG
jgi:signal transduction histidine kinase